MLAKTLGVSSVTARGIIVGRADASLIKAAALYGYEPREDLDVWELSKRRLDPKTAGYRKWSDDEIAAIAERVRTARSTTAVARALGVTPSALRAALLRHGITISSLRGSKE